MIGRADIKKSKSDIAMNAWPPQVSYPCSNFCDTSCLKLVNSKGLIGPAFAVLNRSENQDQASFCPTRESSLTGSSYPADSAKPVPLDVVSLDRDKFRETPPTPHIVHYGFGVGRFSYLFKTVSLCHSKSRTCTPRNIREHPPGAPLCWAGLFRAQEPAAHHCGVAGLGLHVERVQGKKTAYFHPVGTYQSRNESQSDRYANRASETQPDERAPQSQSRSYGSNLPTSLIYIVLVTRGCSPGRPDADIGTAWHENHRLSLGFARDRKGVPRTTRETRCSFEAACPYLGLTPFQGLRTSYEKKKQSLPWCLHGRLRVRLRYRTRDRGLIYFVSGYLNPITFRP
ncbi:uncharacterized protein NPIL_225881 [Nephila pilipes]|uniref:Uncharacterized protein n=1 Tax=Nephila pilipes TaxID=299642 RepID=A0A8X6QV96_NEPPI|nr:uncharacterized protein NPIL_225881 [Nephila pilipes]